MLSSVFRFYFISVWHYVLAAMTCSDGSSRALSVALKFCMIPSPFGLAWANNVVSILGDSTGSIIDGIMDKSILGSLGGKKSKLFSLSLNKFGKEEVFSIDDFGGIGDPSSGKVINILPPNLARITAACLLPVFKFFNARRSF